MNAEYSSKVIYNENGVPYLVNVALVPLTEEGISMIDESVLECLSEEDLEFLNELNFNPLKPIKKVASKAVSKLTSKKGGIGTGNPPTDGQPADKTPSTGSNGQSADSTPSTGSENNSKEKEVKQPTESNDQKATGDKPEEPKVKDSGGDPSSIATDNSSPAPAPQSQPDSAGTPSNTQPQKGVRTNSTPVGTANGEELPDLNTNKPKGISTGAKVAGAAAVGVAGALAAKKIMDRRKKKKSRYNDD